MATIISSETFLDLDDPSEVNLIVTDENDKKYIITVTGSGKKNVLMVESGNDSYEVYGE